MASIREKQVLVGAIIHIECFQVRDFCWNLANVSFLFVVCFKVSDIFSYKMTVAGPGQLQSCTGVWYGCLPCYVLPAYNTEWSNLNQNKGQ